MKKKYTWDESMGSYNTAYNRDEIIALQKRLGVKEDGMYGPITHAAYETSVDVPELTPKSSILDTDTLGLPKTISTDIADKGIVEGGKSDIGTEGASDIGKVGNLVGFASGVTSDLINLGVTLSSKENVKTSPFRGYATEALEKVGELDSMATRMKDLNKADLALSTSTQRAINRNTARGISSLRAMDLGTHIAGLGAQRDIEREYQGRLAENARLETSILLDRDKTTMAAQERTDLINQQNKDAYLSNLSQNITSFGATGQTFGRNINISEQNRINEKLASQGKYGTYDFGYKPSYVKTRF